MQEFEFEGKTTEEAIDKACKELNRPKEELDIEVLEPGSAGIFGIVGTKKARIKVVLPEPEKEEEEGAEVDEVEFAKKTLEDILSLIPAEAEVKAATVDGKVTLSIYGDKSGLLIGRKGKTLDALQFLVNKIVNKALSTKVQVVVDAEDYRQRRKDSLIQTALKLAEKAKRIGKPVATTPLNPKERRIIHLALKDDPQVDTRSRGDGLLKKVLIIPKKG